MRNGDSDGGGSARRALDIAATRVRVARRSALTKPPRV